MSSYAEKHPHPGEKPDLPEALPPVGAPDEERANYRKKAELYNAWVLALRRHAIAKALDELEPKKDKGPAEVICFILGLSWLEESGSHSIGPPDMLSIFLSRL